MWGELLFVAVYLSNRLPYLALGGATSFFKMNSKEEHITYVRVIGARAFVHIETRTTKMENKAWEGKLCGFSRVYHIYNQATGNVLESRNVGEAERRTFLETSAAVRRARLH